ncbi:unnamed protein product [Cylindrotheca closterium]|uniref:Calcineurin-like phosphoesterase domain-containing protein n=1 Tax=Cylindrotheca closterium TaxID=2856 RepID=A0AAD2FUR2_9STRA|nr:unnamed protein product [Cylindrotheca closterium]
MAWIRAFSTIPWSLHRSTILVTAPVANTVFARQGRPRGLSTFARRRKIPDRRITFTARFCSTAKTVQDEFLKEQKQVFITYLTDLEGDKPYLDRYVKISKVLRFSSPSSESTTEFPYDKCIDFATDNSMLVFGGDLWDKGGFDLYVARQLLDLKRRYPNRVFFVCGNRDINKLRILQEMGWEQRDNGKIPDHPGLMWFQGTGRVGDPEGPLPSSDPVERLKWILGNTMGSPDAFELRKNELEWEREQQDTSAAPVTDFDVVQSYRRSCHPNGEMGKFLTNSHLALSIGTLLVLHGALPLTDEYMAPHHNSSNSSVWDDLTFCMPWIKPGESAAKDYGIKSIDDWLDALNTFCHDRIQEWNQEIQRLESTGEGPQIWAHKGGYDHGPSYAGIIQYGMGMTPDRRKNPTVVYNSFTPQGMPHAFDPEAENIAMAQCTREFFDRTNVELILTGHKPQGDMPSPIRVDSSAWVLCCDTSYSGDTIWIQNKNDEDGDRSNIGRGESLSFRGEHAVSEVLVSISVDDQNQNASRLDSVICHGVLSDGREYETVNLLDHKNNSTIGKIAPDAAVPSISDSPHQGRWWTKTIFSNGSSLFHAGEGFNAWNYISKQETQT